jgi:hypothetical protein
VRPSRAAAVKDGPVGGPPVGRVLDGREHAGRLACVGIDCRLVVPDADDRRRLEAIGRGSRRPAEACLARIQSNVRVNSLSPA